MLLHYGKATLDRVELRVPRHIQYDSDVHQLQLLRRVLGRVELRAIHENCDWLLLSEVHKLLNEFDETFTVHRRVIGLHQDKSTVI